MKLFERKKRVWIAVTLIAISTLLTLQNFAVVLTRPTTFGTDYLLGGIVFFALGLWLLAEIWTDGRRQVLAVFTNLVLTSAYVTYAALQLELRPGDSFIAPILYGAIPVILFWLAIYWCIYSDVNGRKA